MVKDPYTRIGLLGSQAIFDHLRLMFGCEHRWPSLSHLTALAGDVQQSRQKAAYADPISHKPSYHWPMFTIGP